MPELTAEQAIERARAETGVPAPARAWRVRRLDRAGDAYYLVVLGTEEAALAVATVGAAAGELRSRARLPGTGAHSLCDAGEAIARAGLGTPAQAELVWRPCRASRSPLDPLWEVQAAGSTVFVDQRGGVWPALEPAGPGG